MSCEMCLGQFANIYSVTNLTTTTLEDDSLMDIWRSLGEWEPWGSREYQDRTQHSEWEQSGRAVHLDVAKTLSLPVECYQRVRVLVVNY